MPRPHGPCGRIALRPKSLCVSQTPCLQVATGTGSCPGICVPVARSRCRTGPSCRRHCAVASNPFLYAQATGLVRGNPSGSFGKEMMARCPRSTWSAGPSLEAVHPPTQTRVVGPAEVAGNTGALIRCSWRSAPWRAAQSRKPTKAAWGSARLFRNPKLGEGVDFTREI